MSEPLHLALLQHACVDDPAQNLAVVSDMIREAAGRGATLIVTQELFKSLYFCVAEDPAAFDLAEPIPGPTTQHLGDLAKELRVSISASLFERRAAGLYHNTSVLIDPTGQIAGKYRKMHIPDDPSYLEKYYFTPGDLGFRAHPLAGTADASSENENATGRVGMLVCWDQWFPEAARLTAMQGAEVLLYPTAIGWHAEDSAEDHAAQLDAWQTVQRSHAIANGVFVAVPNRIGTEGVNTFWGHSFIADPMGRVLAEASSDQPEILTAELDLSMVEKSRREWNLFFRDRRPDAYSGLIQRWGDE
ncbi:MAG: carbon-nitrogen hydrolase [Planctomycetota bacterium]